jgi:hypothetical protein
MMLLLIKNFIKMFKFLTNKSKHQKDIPSINNNNLLKLKNSNIKIIESDIIRSEFNFLKYPFFDLSPRGKELSKITFENKNNGNTVYWNVYSSFGKKLPASFARKVHKKIIEKKLNKLSKPIPRLIGLGSLAQICRELGLRSLETNRVKKALKNIALTSIEAKSTLKTKNKKGERKYIDGIFHLYDGVFFIGDTLPNGTVAEEVYVMLSDFYIQNFNNNFCVPLDYDFIHTLTDVSSRLYELLSIWFYSAITNEKDYAQKPYSYICKSLPLISQNKKWKAKKQLKLCHKQLLDNNFLASEPEWLLVEGKKDDWLIKYIIGERAKQWYEEIKSKSKQINKIEQREVFKEIEQPQVSSITPDTKKDSIFQELTQLNISPERANNILQKHKREKIRDWIDALDYVQPKPQNKPAFFVKAIGEEWQLPVKYIKKKKEKEKELEEEFNKFIINEINKIVEKMDKDQVEEEIKRHKEVFLNKYPAYNRFRDKPFLNPVVEDDYKRMKADELGLMTFEEWKEQRI